MDGAEQTRPWTSEAVLRRSRPGHAVASPHVPRGDAVGAPLERDQAPRLRQRLFRAVSVPMLAGAAVFVAAVVIAIVFTALQSGPASEAAADAGRVASEDAGRSAGAVSHAAKASGGAAAPDAAGTAGATGTAAGASSTRIYVHVIGEVARPGVVEVEAGTRVEAVIAAAGGATDAAVLASLNLAREAVDGEQILVPNAEQAAAGATGGGLPGTSGSAPPGASGGGTAGAGAQGGLVNLNTADAALLETLPRVGPALAQRIIDWRESNGPFASVDQLLDVAGIGAKTLDGFRERVTV